jgi:integrase
MSQELAAVLSRLRKETKAPAGWVFISREGGLINEDWPRRVFAKVLKRAQLPGHTPYDLRHTFSTLHLAWVISSPMSARS